MSFAELHLAKPIVRNLERMGFHTPTPVQAQAVPALLDARDLIAIAPTGTGKTAAFIAPLATLLLNDAGPAKKRQRRSPRAVVLTPTRELAQQVHDEAAAIVRGTAITTGCVFGGVGISSQVAALADGIDILVATPGRLLELIDSGHTDLAQTQHIVLDEADRMLDMGFEPQVNMVLSRALAKRHTACFTATMPPAVESLARAHLTHPIRIAVTEQIETAAHVTQRLFPVAEHLKTRLLQQLLAAPDMQHGTLIFARTKRRVGWIAKALQRHDVRVGVLHGDRSQAQRQRALAGFRTGDLDVLVATDVASRGLHIEAVRTVINYDLPPDAAEYVHRVGRAGHGEAIATGDRPEGDAHPAQGITLLDPRDRTEWMTLTEALGVTLQGEYVPDFDYTEARRGSKGASADSRDGDAGQSSPRKQKRPRRPSPRANEQRSPAKPHEPAKIKQQPKRRHGPGRPIKPGDRPGGGIRKPTDS